jgi:Homeodomain
MSDNSHNNSGGLNLDTNNSADERKVRVRTLISDEQLAVLKAHYLHNPRPKREELEKIADQVSMLLNFFFSLIVSLESLARVLVLSLHFQPNLTFVGMTLS